MSRTALLPFALLTLWAVWIFALQAALGRSAELGPWMPDVGLVLALALASRLPTSDLPWVGLCVGVARAALSVDPPAAVIAAYLGVVGVGRAFRTVVEIKSPPASALLAFVLTLAVASWLGFVHTREAAAALGPSAALEVPIAPVVFAAWRGALATALTAALFSAALAHLPGLSPLHRRRVWRVGASFR